MYCLVFLIVLILTQFSSAVGKWKAEWQERVKSLREKQEAAKESSNETWRGGLILSGHSKGCACGDKLVCPQPSNRCKAPRLKVKHTTLKHRTAEGSRRCILGPDHRNCCTCFRWKLKDRWSFHEQLYASFVSRRCWLTTAIIIIIIGCLILAIFIISVWL